MWMFFFDVVVDCLGLEFVLIFEVFIIDIILLIFGKFFVGYE